MKWTLESIGVLGWLTVALPTALYLFVLVAGFAFFVGMEEKVGLRVWQRTLLTATGVAVFVTMAIALYVFLPMINGELFFQGRYLAPVWLLLLLSAYGIRFTRRRLDCLAMIGVLLVMMVVNLQTLVSFYGRLKSARSPRHSRRAGVGHSYGRRERTRCYAAPAVRTPLLLYGLALVVRAVLIWQLPGPGLPRFVLLRGRGPSAPCRPGLQRRLHLDLRRGRRRRSRPNPVLPIPSNAHWMPLASLVQVPFLASSATSAWASAAAVRADRRDRRAADLGDRPRRRARAPSWRSAPASWPRSRSCRPSTWPSRTTSPCTSRSSPASSGWRRAGLRGSAGSFVAGRAARRPRDAVAERRAAGPRRRSASSSPGTAGGRGASRRWRAPPAISFAAAARLRRGLRPGHGAVVGAPAGGLRLALAVDAPRARSCSSATSASGTASRRRPSLDHLLGMGIGPLLATRIGGLVAAAMIYVTLVCGFVLAPVMVDRRLGAAALDRLRAVLRLCRAPVRLLGAGLGRPRARAARSSTRRSPWRPYSYILALEGWSSPSPGSPARRPAWDAGRATRVFTGATIGFAVVLRRARLARASMPIWAAGATTRVAVAAALDGAGAPPTDRVMSIDAAGTQYCVRPRRRRPGQRPARDDPARSRAPTTSAGSSSTRTIPSPPSRRSSTATEPGLARAQPILQRAGAPVEARRLSRRWRSRRDPARGRPDRAPAIFVVRSLVRAVVRRADRLPEAGGHGLLRRRRAQPRSRAAGWSPTRCGATRRRRSIFPRPAFEVWLPLPTFLAAVPMALFGHDLRRGPGGRPSSSARSCRSSPGGWRPTSPRNAACRRPRPDARDRHRA